jgi:predicted metal-dependent phosphoesterase TrpH
VSRRQPPDPPDRDRRAIDLHLHTTASDGRLPPDALVEFAIAAGVRVMAVTDHDTTAAVPGVLRRAAALGIEAISGIEVTAVDAGRDIHILGYFVDPASEPLQRFLTRQRADRVARVEALAARLAALGMPVDVSPIVREARAGAERSVGRPQVARAMVAAGYASDTNDAFDRWLGVGRPAFVPRSGASCEEVIAAVHGAGGLASVAHPGKSIDDWRIAELRVRGLDAIEVFHPDHDDAAVAHYAALADALGLLSTGGSDFHGDPDHGVTPGSTGLTAEQWARLCAARERDVRQ